MRPFTNIPWMKETLTPKPIRDTGVPREITITEAGTKTNGDIEG